MFIRILFVLFFTGFCSSLFAQNKPLIDTTTRAKGFLSGRLGTGLEGIQEESAKWKKESKAFIDELGVKNIGIKSSMALRKVKKKDVYKDEYEGVKTERRMGSYGSGTRSTVEEFQVVKYVEDEALSVYQQEVWWFDPSQSRVVNSSIKENKSAQICHGPYRKIVNQVVVEQGYFYMGAKDGRWENFGPDGELENKTYYSRGFTAGSEISYYDADKKKIKEVIPRVYGKIRGQYLAFYPGGNLKEEGKMDDSVRVGRWREFHEFGTGGRLKMEWKYKKDKFDEAEPILMVERDPQGKIVYQNTQKFD
jgi:antitoxin component YwqK of YwqJK toxin-antitoxin module